MTAGRTNSSPEHQSNHVIVGHRVADEVLTGIIWYRFLARIPSNTATTGQTGPEASIQSTDNNGDTFTAGFQYLANIYDRPGHWQIWHIDDEENPWKDLTADLGLQPELLEPDLSYEITIGADYSTNRYIGFSVRIAEGPFVLYLKASDLSEYEITAEQKGFAQATKITLEAENRHNSCRPEDPDGDGSAYSYEVIYDNVVTCIDQ